MRHAAIHLLTAASLLLLQACSSGAESPITEGSSSSGGSSSSSSSGGSSSGGGNGNPPIARSYSRTLAEDSSISANFSATGSGSITYTLVSPPAQGTLSGTPPSLTYTPRADYNGSDQFSYRASNASGDSAIATVTLTITPVNDRPSATDLDLGTREDEAVALTLGGSDIDGNPLTYSVVASPTHGSLSGTAPNLIYTPAADYNGSDAFTYRVNDGTVNSTNARVSIAITPVNDTPRAANVTVNGTEDRTSSLQLAGSDADGDALTYEILVLPTHGGLSPNGSGGASRSYLPDANFNGSDTLTYVVKDASGRSSSPATVNFSIAAVNDVPRASDLSFSVLAGSTTAFTLQGSDADGDTLSYLTNPPSRGSLSGTGATVNYTAPATAGTAQFSYRVNDGIADSTGALVRITITAQVSAQVLGPIAGATVRITPLQTKAANGAAADLAVLGSPRSLSTSAFNGKLDETGVFLINVDDFGSDDSRIGAYLIEASGGQNYDANADDVADASPTPNLGVLRAVVSRADLMAGNFKVSALTTALADRVPLALQRATLPEANSRLNADAALLLGSDLNADSVIDAKDALVFNPARQRAALRRPASSFVAFTTGISAGSHDVMDSHRLLAPQLSSPGIEGSAVVVRGSTAYSVATTAQNTARFNITDISLPEAPKRIGSTAVLATSFDDVLTLVGNLAYVSSIDSSGNSGLATVNVSNPAAPVFDPTLRITGTVRSPVVSGNVMFLLNISTDRLEAYDISSPVSPTLIGQIQAGSRCRTLAMAGSSLFAACGNDTLVTVDASNPASMFTTASLTLGSGGSSTPGLRSAISIEGSRLAVHFARATSPVYVVDVSNPNAPQPQGSLLPPSNSNALRALLLQGGYAYLASLNQRLLVLDLRMPGAYSELGSYRSLGFAPRSLQMVGTKLLAGEGSTLAFYDLAAPLADTTPIASLAGLLSSFTLGLYTLPDSSNQQGIVFTAGDRSNVLDVPSRSEVAANDNPFAVAVSGSDGYAALLNQFINQIDSNPPTSITQLTVTAFAGNGPRTNSNALGSDATTITLVDSPDTTVSATALHSLGDVTLVAHSSGLIKVATPATNPGAVQVLETLAPLPGAPVQVQQFMAQDGSGALQRHAAVLVAPANATAPDFYLLRIADAGGYTVLGSFRYGGTSADCLNSVQVETDRPDGRRYAYLGCGAASGLKVIDITDLASPKLAASLPADQGILQLHLPGGAINLPARQQNYRLLLSAEGGFGLRIIDITDPTAPKTLEVVETYSRSFSAALLTRSPYRLISGESLGVVPLANPFYPVR